jgi:hypothetical protein
LLTRSKNILLLISYTSILFLSIPYVRLIESWLQGLQVFMLTVYLIIIIYLIFIYIIVIRRVGFSRRNFIIFTLYSAAYLALIMSYRSFDQKMHFVEYGVLSFLTYNALKPFIGKAMVYPFTLALIALIGYIDEFIQFFFPFRSYDMGDLLIDVIAALIILVKIFMVNMLQSDNRDSNTLSSSAT